MEIKINALAVKTPQYEVSRDRFFELMQIKKTTDHYDIHGKKEVRISKAKSKMTTFGRHMPTRIKPEFIKGPYALVCLLTSADKDPDNPDSYTHAATIIFSEDEATKVYRDSLNDGFIDAKFTDDTVMLISIQNTKTKETKYVQIDGEPTGLQSWKFEEEDDTINQHNREVIEEYGKKVQKELNLPEEQVFIVIQLEDA